MIWPWLERIPLLTLSSSVEFNEEKFPKLFAYYQRMMQLPAVKECHIPAETVAKFFASYLSDGEVDYDCGLKENL